MKTVFLVLLTMVVVQSNLLAKEVEGIIFDDLNRNGILDKGEKGIEGVVVSNQKDVVTTDSKGRYKLDLRSKAFIFVVKPSNFDVPTDNLNLPKFYQAYYPDGSPDYLKYKGIDKTDKDLSIVNFPLIKSEENKPLKALLIGDPQTADNERLSYFREGVEDMIRQDADFYIVYGDIADNNLEIYEREREIVGSLGIPGYHVPGNHDINYLSREEQDHMATFKKMYGPDYYSFNYDKTHFIVLNNVRYDGWNNKDSKQGSYFGGLDATQLEWLKNDIATVSDEYSIVINSHIPFLEAYTHKESILDLFNTLQDRDNLIAFSGHLHATQSLWFNSSTNWNGKGKFESMTVGATCGAWWANPKDEDGVPISTCMDGTPKGYFTMDIDNGSYNYSFIPSNRDDSFQIRIASPESSISSSDIETTDIIANIFVGKPTFKVEVIIDGRPSIEMKNITGEDPFLARSLNNRLNADNWAPVLHKTDHLWKVKLPSDLTKGVHKIEVIGYGDRGNIYRGFHLLEII